MQVIIETPRYSFVKYRHTGEDFVREFISPLPTLFNYGYVVGTNAQDGMQKDAIVLGPTLKQGQSIIVKELAVVRFIDDGKVDDKSITSEEDFFGWFDKIKVHLFFSAYMIFKAVYYLLSERRFARCRYLGLRVG